MKYQLLEDEREQVQLAAAYSECAAVARSEARNFYFAFLPLNRERRNALYTIYSFARLADDLADEDSWSRDTRLEKLLELEAKLEGMLRGEIRGALFIALADAVDKYRVPVDALRDLMRGVKQDQRITRYQTYEELSRYCYYVAGTIGLICTAVFGGKSPEARKYAEAQGLGMQLINIMRDVGSDAAVDRIYIPAELMREHGVTESDILEGRTSEGWRALMDELSVRAREALREGENLLPLIDEDARICPALLRELYEKILRRLEAARFDVFSSNINLNLHSKIGLLLTTWWRYRFRT